MKNLQIIKLERLKKTKLQRISLYGEVHGLNKCLKRIEKKLNRQLNKEFKRGKRIEELKTIKVLYIKYYPFLIENREVEEEFCEILNENHISIEKYFCDMTPLSMFINILPFNGNYAETLCDATLDVEKAIQKSKNINR